MCEAKRNILVSRIAETLFLTTHLAPQAGLDLSSKKVAVFGLGDSLSYGDYFCDASGIVHLFMAILLTPQVHES